MEIVSKSLKETEKAAKTFLKELEAKVEEMKPENATVVALFGDLGSGKTAFTQAFGKLLDAKGPIQSPTFVIEKLYPIHHPIWSTLVHVDTYRLETAGELERIGWANTLKNKSNLIFIEWPDRVKELLPEKYISIQFEFVNETTRKISF